MENAITITGTTENSVNLCRFLPDYIKKNSYGKNMIFMFYLETQNLLKPLMTQMKGSMLKYILLNHKKICKPQTLLLRRV